MAPDERLGSRGTRVDLRSTGVSAVRTNSDVTSELWTRTARASISPLYNREGLPQRRYTIRGENGSDGRLLRSLERAALGLVARFPIDSNLFAIGLVSQKWSNARKVLT